MCKVIPSLFLNIFVLELSVYKFCVYWCISIPPGQEKFAAIAELKGWGYSNSDVRGYLGALSVLQVYIAPFLACFSVFTWYKTD